MLDDSDFTTPNTSTVAELGSPDELNSPSEIFGQKESFSEAVSLLPNNIPTTTEHDIEPSIVVVEGDNDDLLVCLCFVSF